MRINRLNGQRGMALLVTLSVITVLFAVAMEMNRKMRSAVGHAAATRDKITLTHMAASGVQAAMALLVRDKKDTDIDSDQEDWADPEKTAEFLQALPFEQGQLSVQILDEMAKIQVNALIDFPEGRQFKEPQRMMWDRFLGRLFGQFELESGDTEQQAIINSVKDWLDRGDDDAITGISGAESDYYQDLQPPYACKNGPVYQLEELILVKGIEPEIFYGMDEIAGIENYMTVFGMTPSADGKGAAFSGKININTADMAVIAALLPTGDEAFAQPIYEYRIETSDGVFIHDLTNPKWYKNAPGCSDVEIAAALITTSSDVFRIESLAALDPMKASVSAVVQREKDKKSGKWQCKVLSWRVK